MDNEFKTFLARSNYDGASWGFRFQARNHEDAEARLARMSWGQIDGELMMEIPVAAGGGGLLARVICWFQNMRRSPHRA